MKTLRMSEQTMFQTIINTLGDLRDDVQSRFDEVDKKLESIRDRTEHHERLLDMNAKYILSNRTLFQGLEQKVGKNTEVVMSIAEALEIRNEATKHGLRQFDTFLQEIRSKK